MRTRVQYSTIRVTAPSRSLFDPERDRLGVFKGEEDSKRLEEPNLPPLALTRPSEGNQRNAPVLEGLAPSRRMAAPTSRASR